MSVIRVDHLTKTFGRMHAVDDVSFEVQAGEILAIIGASGCGKTTTLRCIAGLETPTRGTIEIGGTVVASRDVFVAPEKRGIGMVFQSYALWPHKTVFENIAYGLVIRRAAKAAIRDTVARMIDLVGLRGMENRYPATLSGGQQQRVALARSAVGEPRVLLLDEPLSNLDAKLREYMRDELKHLIKKLNITAVHITHDQTEAMAIADRIICMRSGKIEQAGNGRELYRSPANRFVADFIGMATFLDGTVVREKDGGPAVIRLAHGVELCSSCAATQADARALTVALRPENVHLSLSQPQGPNVLSGRIVAESFLGDHTQYVVDVNGVRMKARSLQDYTVGASIFISIAPECVVCLPREPSGAPAAAADAQLLPPATTA